MKILIVEDEKNIRENIHEILEIKGFEVFEAKDGMEGVEAFMTERPDFVLCDIMMPRLDGYGFLATIKQLPKTEQVPVVFLSAKAEKDEYDKAIRFGASDFLTKPFSFEELFKVIDKYSLK